jgi:hypothetical protein
MAQESQFRAALFGGFQKADVLAYIESMQKQILTLQGEHQQRGRELPALRAQLQELTEELEQARIRERDFLDSAEELQRQLLVIEQERDDLRLRLERASVGQERVKDVEGQVGTLILDALLYSEKIIARAKETAQIIARRAQETMRSSAQEVDGLSDDMTQISRDLSESITKLAGRIKGVSQELSGVTVKLEPDLSDGSEQYEFSEEGLPILREEEPQEEQLVLPGVQEEQPGQEDGQTKIQDIYSSTELAIRNGHTANSLPTELFPQAPVLPPDELGQPPVGTPPEEE